VFYDSSGNGISSIAACTFSIFTTGEVYDCKKFKINKISYTAWGVNKNREFPHITKSVHLIYANPASSAASERRFCTEDRGIEHRNISETAHLTIPQLETPTLFPLTAPPFTAAPSATISQYIKGRR
jgi:hypothetical protein